GAQYCEARPDPAGGIRRDRRGRARVGQEPGLSVDWEGMRHAVPFAQLLDEAVAAGAVASSLPRSTPPTAFPRAVGFFEFTVAAQQTPRIVPHLPSQYEVVAGPPVNSRLPNADSQTVGSWKLELESFRAKTRLTRAQRKAVEDMVSLGASLNA